MDTLHLPPPPTPPPQPIHLPTHSPPPHPITSCWGLTKFGPSQKRCHPSGGSHTFHPPTPHPTPHHGGTFLAQAQGTERTSWTSCCATEFMDSVFSGTKFCWLDVLPVFRMLVLIYWNDTLVNTYMKHTLANVTITVNSHVIHFWISQLQKGNTSWRGTHWHGLCPHIHGVHKEGG